MTRTKSNLARPPLLAPERRRHADAAPFEPFAAKPSASAKLLAATGGALVPPALHFLLQIEGVLQRDGSERAMHSRSRPRRHVPSTLVPRSHWRSR